jgi:hypothetical protein
LYFERAVEADPDHAKSAAALAHTYIHLVTAGPTEGAEILTRASALAQRAVDLAPTLADGHVALGVTRLLYERDVAAAEESLTAAIALDPAGAAAHRWYAKLLSFSARHGEAVAEVRRALQADPLSLSVRRDLVETLFLARAYDEAADEAQRLIRMAGQAPDIQLGLSWIYYLNGDEQKAFEAVRNGFQSLGTNQRVLDQTARTFERGGMRAVLRLWVEFLTVQAAFGQKTLDLAFLYALLDERDHAFAAIEMILRSGHPAWLSLPVSPLLDSLRTDARYADLLSRLAKRIER